MVSVAAADVSMTMLLTSAPLRKVVGRRGCGSGLAKTDHQGCGSFEGKNLELSQHPGQTRVVYSANRVEVDFHASTMIVVAIKINCRWEYLAAPGLR